MIVLIMFWVVWCLLWNVWGRDLRVCSVLCRVLFVSLMVIVVLNISIMGVGSSRELMVVFLMLIMVIRVLKVRIRLRISDGFIRVLFWSCGWCLFCWW